MTEDLQANDKALRRTSDHSPAARINSISIPIIKNSMRIMEGVFYSHQGLNFKVYSFWRQQSMCSGPKPQESHKTDSPYSSSHCR
uniref:BRASSINOSTEROID INSENSITIVE 1-associated receptor kinase 1 n=1 Tax=Rhizophora mucronata TaxID=61149 RepID=A0A2P2KHJ3_RHIMU